MNVKVTFWRYLGHLNAVFSFNFKNVKKVHVVKFNFQVYSSILLDNSEDRF